MVTSEAAFCTSELASMRILPVEAITSLFSVMPARAFMIMSFFA